MVKYLINAVNTVRIHTLAEVEAFHEELKHDPNFELVQFNYTVKDIKERKEVIDNYYVVKYKLVFNSEKEPERQISVTYEDE